MSDSENYVPPPQPAPQPKVSLEVIKEAAGGISSIPRASLESVKADSQGQRVVKIAPPPPPPPPPSVDYEKKSIDGDSKHY